MNRFGHASNAELDTCDDRLRRIAYPALLIKDHSIIKGHRGEIEQNAAFASGASKLPWPKGKHNALPSKAMDVRTWPPPAPLTFAHDPEKMSPAELRREVVRLRSMLREQPLREEQVYLLGIYKGTAAAMRIPLRTGGDWNRNGVIADNRFDDLFHVEIDEP